MNEDERLEALLELHKEMSITLKYRPKGWMGTVSVFGADHDNRKHREDVFAALEESIQSFYTIEEEELKQWHAH